MHSATDNVIIAGVGLVLTMVLHIQKINGTFTSIKNITLDSYDIVATRNSKSTGDIGGATVTATQNVPFNILQLQIGHVLHPQTSISPSVRTTSGKSVHGSETPFVRQSTAEKRNVVLGDNIYYTEPRLVASRINESNEMAGQKSLTSNDYDNFKC